jgi:hypothetical protein
MIGGILWENVKISRDDKMIAEQASKETKTV